MTTRSLPKEGKLMIDNYVYQLKPPDLNAGDLERVTKYRRELAEHLLHTDADLNIIHDVRSFFFLYFFKKS